MPFSAIDPNTGKLEGVEHFMRLGIEHGVCDLCDAEMGIRGDITSDKRPHFVHPEDDIKCISTKINKLNYENLTANNFDFEAGKNIREQVKDNLYHIYASCVTITNSFLKYEDFCSLLKKASEKKVWDYKGLTLNYVPYILLTLHDSLEGYFKGVSGPVKYRIILEPRLSAFDDLWIKPNMKQKIWKVDKNSGDTIEIMDISMSPLMVLKPEFFNKNRIHVK